MIIVGTAIYISFHHPSNFDIHHMEVTGYLRFVYAQTRIDSTSLWGERFSWVMPFLGNLYGAELQYHSQNAFQQGDERAEYRIIPQFPEKDIDKLIPSIDVCTSKSLHTHFSGCQFPKARIVCQCTLLLICSDIGLLPYYWNLGHYSNVIWCR